MKIQKYYKTQEKAQKDAQKFNCDIVTGFVQYSGGLGNDLFYLVPKDAPAGVVLKRKQINYRYKIAYKFSNGDIEFIDDVTAYRLGVLEQGLIPENKVSNYARGYYTRREETSEIIKERKENARISHFYCTAGGAEGHELRQQIRRDLRAGLKQ